MELLRCIIASLEAIIREFNPKYGTLKGAATQTKPAYAGFVCIAPGFSLGDLGV